MEEYVWRTPAEADIAELLFRMFIEDCRRVAKVFFLQIGPIRQGKPPDRAFMRRFQHYPMPIKTIADTDGQYLAGVYDRATQIQGIILAVITFNWVQHDTVMVEAGWYRGGRSALYLRFQMVQQDGQWAVADQKIIGVS